MPTRRIDGPDMEPCPFCGLPGGLYEAIGMDGVARYLTGCDDLHCRGRWMNDYASHTKAHAVSAWNKRAEKVCQKTDEETAARADAEILVNARDERKRRMYQMGA